MPKDNSYPQRHAKGFLIPAIDQPCSHGPDCMSCFASEFMDRIQDFFEACVAAHGEVVAHEMHTALMATVFAGGVSVSISDDDLQKADGDILKLAQAKQDDIFDMMDLHADYHSQLDEDAPAPGTIEAEPPTASFH